MLVTVLALVGLALPTDAAADIPAQTPFAAMVAKARTQADCLFGCPPYPIMPGRDPLPRDAYSTEFLGRLVVFMVEVRVRRERPGDLSPGDFSSFQVALNVLGRYWTCLEGGLEAGSDGDYATIEAIDRLGERAADQCKDRREQSMRVIGFRGPDFGSFDPLADSGKPQAAVSELLQRIQRFAIAYYAGRRGVQWDRWPELAPLPKAVPGAGPAPRSE